MSPSALQSGIAVRAADLSLAYADGRAAVSGATFEIPVGGILGVVGEAGSGKSTLARAVAAQTLPGEGEAPQIVGGLLEVLAKTAQHDSATPGPAHAQGRLPAAGRRVDAGATPDHRREHRRAHLQARPALRPPRGGRRGRDPGRRRAAPALGDGQVPARTQPRPAAAHRVGAGAHSGTGAAGRRRPDHGRRRTRARPHPDRHRRHAARARRSRRS